MRITTTDIPQQEVITKDNVPVGINAVVYFKVENAEIAILNIKDYTTAVSQYAQAALRDVIGGVELDSLLSEREKIAEEIQKIVVAATQSWGILVTDIKIQDIECSNPKLTQSVFQRPQQGLRFLNPVLFLILACAHSCLPIPRKINRPYYQNSDRACVC